MGSSLRRSLTAAVCAAALISCGGGTDPSPVELAGVDRNADGVRDDVATRIDSYDAELRPYLIDVAANEQRIVTFDPDTADTGAAWQIAQEANVLISCVPAGLDRDAALAAAEEVRDLVGDTAARRARREKLTAAISGSSFPTPSCDTPDTAPPQPVR